MKITWSKSSKESSLQQSTVSFTDLDQSSGMIIIESLLTTFEAIVIFFAAAGTVAKIGSSLKLNHHKQI